MKIEEFKKKYDQLLGKLNPAIIDILLAVIPPKKQNLLYLLVHDKKTADMLLERNILPENIAVESLWENNIPKEYLEWLVSHNYKNADKIIEHVYIREGKDRSTYLYALQHAPIDSFAGLYKVKREEEINALFSNVNFDFELLIEKINFTKTKRTISDEVFPYLLEKYPVEKFVKWVKENDLHIKTIFSLIEKELVSESVLNELDNEGRPLYLMVQGLEDLIDKKTGKLFNIDLSLSEGELVYKSCHSPLGGNNFINFIELIPSQWINMRDKQGRTILFSLSLDNSPLSYMEKVELFVEKGGNILLKNNEGKSALVKDLSYNTNFFEILTWEGKIDITATEYSELFQDIMNALNERISRQKEPEELILLRNYVEQKVLSRSIQHKEPETNKIVRL